ncbi:PTPA-CTERM sorting domain-containing protein [Alkalinema pantanalense CENA528]|uniref:PTPA-CTERM sorting domain-containing protein n=1 Tax=Alkalinema pantanalense TaxID=1620705 RepID=UPI003D6E9243
MNFKGLGLSTLAAAATLAVASITASPVEAATFTYDFSGGPLLPSVYNFSGSAPLTSVTANSGSVVWRPNGLGIWQGGLDSLQVDGLGINEVLNFTFNQTVKIISATFSRVGVNVPFIDPNGKDDFRLLVDGTEVLAADIPGGNLLDLGTGTYSFSPSIAQGSTFGLGVINRGDDYLLTNLTVETIPTPAMLPGLIGMGVVVLRKRKGAQAASEQNC